MLCFDPEVTHRVDDEQSVFFDSFLLENQSKPVVEAVKKEFEVLIIPSYELAGKQHLLLVNLRSGQPLYVYSEVEVIGLSVLY